MTLVFGLKRAQGGKRGRWSRKFPRKRILAKREGKAAHWFRNNWIDDSYTYLHGSIHRFLLANTGRPVDRVFSEFLRRCDRTAHKCNLKYEFYDCFEEESKIDYHGGFYLTNGIVNYKGPTRKPESKPYILIEDRNRAAVPVLAPICRGCDATHTKQFLGVFWLSYGTQKRVYLIEKGVYDTDLNLQAKYKPCYIHGVGRGVNECLSWGYQGKPRYELYVGWYSEDLSSKYIFITKG